MGHHPQYEMDHLASYPGCSLAGQGKYLKLNREVDTLRETLTPRRRGSSEGQRWSCKMQGEAFTSIKEGQQGGVGDTPADHIKSCTNHDPPRAEEVDQSCRRTLSFESSI